MSNPITNPFADSALASQDLSKINSSGQGNKTTGGIFAFGSGQNTDNKTSILNPQSSIGKKNEAGNFTGNPVIQTRNFGSTKPESLSAQGSDLEMKFKTTVGSDKPQTQPAEKSKTQSIFFDQPIIDPSKAQPGLNNTTENTTNVISGFKSSKIIQDTPINLALNPQIKPVESSASIISSNILDFTKMPDLSPQISLPNAKSKILDLFKTWKSKFDELYEHFKTNTEKITKTELIFYENQKELIAIQEMTHKISSTSTHINDHLDTIMREQQELNSTLDGIESELDILLKKYELDRIKSGIDERENLYNKANIVKQNVEEIQKTLSEIDNYINPDTYESTNTLHGVIESLNQIEANTFMLESKLNAIEKQAKIKKNII